MSVSQFVLIGIWLLTGEYKAKLLTLLQNKNAMLLIDLFLVYLFGLFYSTNYADAWHEIRIKLPLLVFPLIFSWYVLEKKQVIYIAILSIISVFLCTFYGFLVYAHLTPIEYEDIREISRFISHIRLSLEVVLSIFLILAFPWPTFKYKTIIQISLLAWFLFYLVISQSLTGLIILGIGLIFFAISTLVSNKNRWLKWGVLTCILVGIGYLSYIFYYEYHFYQNLETKNPTEYPLKTIRGNEYFQDMQSTQVENGHYIWRFVCWKEIEQEWNKISKNTFLQKDNKGNPQYATLIRYMTSKGLTKDIEGFSKLSGQDIQNIEKGYTNVRFTHEHSLSKRIYELFWELDAYFKGIPPMKGSISQRLEFWKVAIQTIGSDLWIGKGTGNVQKMMIPAYEKSLLQKNPEYWLKPHQQFLTLAIQFGWVQSFFVLGTFLLLLYRFWNVPIYPYFFWIFFASFFTEDTLDTQAGLTWYIFFQCFFVLCMGSYFKINASTNKSKIKPENLNTI